MVSSIPSLSGETGEFESIAHRMGDRDIPLEEFQKTITINLTASFLLVKGVVEHMKQKKWGRIIFVSSISAKGVGINGCRM